MVCGTGRKGRHAEMAREAAGREKGIERGGGELDGRSAAGIPPWPFSERGVQLLG